MKLNEGVYDKYIFKAIFLAGTPGSGKNFFLNKTLYSFKNMDPDAIRMLLYKKKGMTADHYKQSPKERKTADEEIHPTTNKKTVKKEDITIKNRLPIIMNRTGSDFERTKKMKERLEALGYETKMIFISSGLDTSLERNNARDRRLDNEFVKATHKKVAANVGKFKDLFGSDFHVVDNATPADKKQEVFGEMWKRLAAWVDRPVNNAKAKSWKEEQLRRKGNRVSGTIEKMRSDVKGTLK